MKILASLCVLRCTSGTHVTSVVLADSLLISKATKDTCKDSFQLAFELLHENVCNLLTPTFPNVIWQAFIHPNHFLTASLWIILTLRWLCFVLVGMIGMIHTFTTFIYDTYIYDISFMIYDTYIHLGYICIHVLCIHIPSKSSPRFARSSWRAAAEWNSLVSWTSIRPLEINRPR